MKSITSGTYAALLFVLAMMTSLYISSSVQPQWREQALSFNIYQNDAGVQVYKYKGKELPVGETIPYEQSQLRQQALDTATERPALEEQWVVKQNPKTREPQIQLLKLKFHFGLWSLLPAFIAIALCLLTKEPVTALLGGIVCGAFMLGRVDLIEDVLIPNLASTSAAG
ncbi:MAG: sodium:proton antiporter, partial [Psychrosphaera sp.]|nr:sodium:proton antiporter [Psychrosphaera sp.]